MNAADGASLVCELREVGRLVLGFRFRVLHELQRLPSARLGNSRTPMSLRRQHLADRYSSTRSNRSED
jgi:hypothetical protein